MKRPNGTYTRLDPLIEELYVAGIPPAMIADKLNLDVRGVSKRIYDREMGLAKEERQAQVASSIIQRFFDGRTPHDPG